METLAYTEVQLEPVQIYCRRYLDLKRLRNCDVSVEKMTHLSIEDLCIQLEKHIHGLPEQRIVIKEKYPVNWVEAVRERWLPKWLLKRYPVKYRRIDIDQKIYKAVFTDLNTPDKRPILRELHRY